MLARGKLQAQAVGLTPVDLLDTLQADGSALGLVIDQRAVDHRLAPREPHLLRRVRLHVRAAVAGWPHFPPVRPIKDTQRSLADPTDLETRLVGTLLLQHEGHAGHGSAGP